LSRFAVSSNIFGGEVGPVPSEKIVESQDLNVCLREAVMACLSGRESSRDCFGAGRLPFEPFRAAARTECNEKCRLSSTRCGCEDRPRGNLWKGIQSGLVQKAGGTALRRLGFWSSVKMEVPIENRKRPAALLRPRPVRSIQRGVTLTCR
jgi:hypothetical protein